MKQLIRGVAVVAVVLAGLGLRLEAQSVIIQQIIVKVNGEVFTETELEQLQIQALQEKNRQVSNPADLQNDATLRGLLAEVTPDILVRTVENLLLVQRGRELGFRLSDAQFKDAVEKLKKDNKLNDDQFKAALAQQHLTLDELRQNMERQYLIQGVQSQDIMAHMNLTDQEARQYYQAHPSEFTKPATVTLREMFAAVPTQTQGGQPVFSAADDEAAKAKITAARDRLLKGEDFAKVASEVSDSPSKSAGGLLGTFNITEMMPALRDVVDKLKPGDVSEPVRSSRGYQIFKLDSRVPESLLPFDQVHDQIFQHVYDQRLDGEQKKYLDKLRAQALIEWKVDDYHKMYDKRMAELKAGSGQ